MTGLVQIASVCHRLTEHTGKTRCRAASDKLVNYLKALQLRKPSGAAMVGAVAGSFPLFGANLRAGYPNWATKYFLDALMVQLACANAQD